MIDMLHYLDHAFPSAAGKIIVGATRHEDGSWGGLDSMDSHQARGRLLHGLESVAEIGPVEYSESVDAEYPQETGHAAFDLLVATASVVASLASLLSAWISARPRKDRDTVPGIRLQTDEASLVVSHRLPVDQQRLLIEAFLTAVRRSAQPL